jgi:hypothetical protein
MKFFFHATDVGIVDVGLIEKSGLRQRPKDRLEVLVAYLITEMSLADCRVNGLGPYLERCNQRLRGTCRAVSRGYARPANVRVEGIPRVLQLGGTSCWNSALSIGLIEAWGAGRIWRLARLYVDVRAKHRRPCQAL